MESVGICVRVKDSRCFARPLHLVAEIEDAVGFRLPAAVPPIRVAARCSEEGDGADDVNAPRIENRADLDHLVRGPSDEHVKSRLTGARDGGVRRLPVAEDAGAVSREVDACERHAAVAHARGAVEEKLLVEDRADAGAECTCAGGRAIGEVEVFHLCRATAEEWAFVRLRWRVGANLDAADDHAGFELWTIVRERRTGRDSRLRDLILSRDFGVRTQAVRQRELGRRVSGGAIGEVADEMIRDWNRRDRDDGYVVVRETGWPAVIREEEILVRRIAGTGRNREVDDRIPADLRYRECAHEAALRRQVQIVHFEWIDRCGRGVRIALITAIGTRRARGIVERETHTHLVRVAGHVEERKLLLPEAREERIPDWLGQRTPVERGGSRCRATRGNGVAIHRIAWRRRSVAPGIQRPRQNAFGLRPDRGERKAGPDCIGLIVLRGLFPRDRRHQQLRRPIDAPRVARSQPAHVGRIRIGKRWQQCVETKAEPDCGALHHLVVTQRAEQQQTVDRCDSEEGIPDGE